MVRSSVLSVNIPWKVEMEGCRIERKRGVLVLVSVKEEVKGAAEVLEEEVEGAAEVSEEADAEVVVRVMVINSARSVVGMNTEKSAEMSARTESVQSVFSLLIEFRGRG